MKACTVVELGQWDLILLDSISCKNKNTFRRINRRVNYSCKLHFEVDSLLVFLFGIPISFQIIKSLMIWPLVRNYKLSFATKCRTFCVDVSLRCHWVGSMRPHSPWFNFMKSKNIFRVSDVYIDYSCHSHSEYNKNI